MLSQGKTEGVFQLESGGMKSVLMQLHPKSLEDITAVISLYRPGPMDSIPTYVDNSFHPERVTYKHPLLKNILSVTYGCMVYQEQVMEIVRTLAGYSYGRADLVRRAMGKKKIEVMKQEREYFINGKLAADGSIEVPGSVRNGVPAEIADQIFDEMVKFAQYAFNKSHAAAYAFVSYYTAYLMCHHKKEYMAALLTSVVSKPDKMVGYIVACQGHNIDMLPPDVNKSESVFSVEENGIRFGLSGLKGMGKNVVDAIIEEREVSGPFLNFYDFCKRMLSNHDLDSRSVECLIKCGAFDSFGLKRRQLEIAYPEVKKALQVVIKQEREGQMSLFGGMEEEQQDNFEYPDVEEYPKKLKLSYEKEISGVYLSDHPMKEYAEIIAERDLPTVADLNSDETYKNNSRVSIIGIVSKFTKKMTKSETMMGIMQVQDLTGNIEVLLFSKTFDKYSHDIEEDAVVQITGKLSKPEDTAPTPDDGGEEGGFAETAKLIASEISKVDSPNEVSISAPSLTQKKQDQYLSIMITKNDMSCINKCAEIIENFPGTSKVFFTFTDMGKQARFRTDVQISDKLISALSDVLGQGKVEAKNL
jgi:DNA polymerase-3 subunit alpha